MSSRNSTKYLNGSSFHYDKNHINGISFSKTLLLTPFVVIFVILLSVLKREKISYHWRVSKNQGKPYRFISDNFCDKVNSTDNFQAYHMVKKRAFSKRQHHLVPLYHFDPGECDNWEDEILEDPMKYTSKMGHQYYSSMRVLW